MGVTTTQTNKPFNPRGNDQSPLGFNRAKLFSGKALDFDGANDSVSITTSSFDLYAISFYFKGAIGTGTNGFVFHTGGATNDGVAIGHLTSTLTNETVTIGNAGNYTAINESYDDGIHFVVFSWDATNSKYKAYINAQEVDTFNNGTNAALLTGVTAPKLGYRPSFNDFYLDGGLSNVRAFNTALTPAQVADLYNNPEKVVPTGVDNTALKLWLPMQEGAGTTAYNGAPDALGSELVTNGDFATNSDWTLASGSTISGGSLNIVSAPYNANTKQTISLTSGKTYIVNINATATGSSTDNTFQLGFGDSAGNPSSLTQHEFALGTSTKSLFITASATDATIVFRSRDAGTSDLSVHSVSAKEITGLGTISGATWTHGIGAPVAQTAVISWNKFTLDLSNEVLIPQGLTAGRDLLGNLFENVRKQGALNLDGNSWAEVHDNESFDLAELTLECWFYAATTIASDGLLGQWVGNQGYLLYAANGSNFAFYVDSQSVNYLTALTGWNHIVGVYNGAKIQLYINGAKESESNRTADPTLVSAPIEIGRFQENVSTQYGNQIAQPRIYNRALTAAEVQKNYNAGKNTYTN